MRALNVFAFGDAQVQTRNHVMAPRAPLDRLPVGDQIYRAAFTRSATSRRGDMLNKAETFPIAAAAEEGIERRRFLRAAGAAALAVVAGEWAAAHLDETARHSKLLEVQFDATPSLRIGEARSVADAAGREALVVRLDDTTVVAFDRRCPHLRCPGAVGA